MEFVHHLLLLKAKINIYINNINRILSGLKKTVDPITYVLEYDKIRISLISKNVTQNLKFLGIDGWMSDIKKDSKEKGCLGANWIHLAQDRDNWLAFFWCDNELLCSLIRGEFLEWPRNYSIVKMDPASWSYVVLFHVRTGKWKAFT